MSKPETMAKTDQKQRSRRRAMLAALAATFACLGLLGAAPAQGAALELTGYFGGILEVPDPPDSWPEEEQLGGTGGMAVNYTGAGGVEAGTVYVATAFFANTRIAVFKPQGEGLAFSYGWEVKQTEGPYERCGPDLVPDSACPVRVKAPAGNVDVEVDQGTGNVYVKTETVEAGLTTIAVFKPEGEEVLARFGEIGGSGQTTAASPDKVHGSGEPGGIAVNEDGEVYLYDRNSFDNNYERLMKFVPSVPGIYTDYEYAGIGKDVAAGEGTEPTRPVVDAAGSLYVTPSSGGNRIQMFDPDNPGDPAVCEYKPPRAGVTTIAVNPLDGEVFFFSFRKEGGADFKTVHQLGPCNPGTHKFGEDKVIGQVEVDPERDDLSALAFDPVRELAPSRPAGVLYGAAPAPVPSSGFGQGQPGRGSLGYIFAPQEENPPEVEEQSVSKVTATSAQLHAIIAPNGFKTRYLFQYMTEAAFEEAAEPFAGASEAPVGEAFLKGTGSPQAVAVTLTGLSPDTAYRYRVVASSNCAPGEEGKVCEVAGAAQTFRTYPPESGELPDDRAYELVSPVQKNGGQVFPADPFVLSCKGSGCKSKPGLTYAHFPMQSTPGGEAVAYEGFSFSPGAGTPRENEYVARRTDTGWSSTQLSPVGGGNYGALDTALTEAALQQGSPTLSPQAPPGYANVYSQAVAEPSLFKPLVAAKPPNRSSGNFQTTFAAAAADLSRIFFVANDALTKATAVAPAAEDGGLSKFNLYEWERASETLRLVNVLPDNTTKAGAAFGTGGSANTVSADGSRAFFTSDGQLYVREGAVETREIPDAGKFLSASTDGSKVLLANGHLYDLEADKTTDLTGGKGGFEGLVGQSDDLSHVYFVTAPSSGTGDLTEGSAAVTDVKAGAGAFSVGQRIEGTGIPAGTTILAVGAGTLQLSAPATETVDNAPLVAQALLTGGVNSEGDAAQVKGHNLYAWEGGTTTFVGALVAQDNGGGSELSHSWSSPPSDRTAEASPSGRFLAFLSHAPLTSYDNTGPCGSDHAGGFVEAPCPEAYLYDSATGELDCASCNPSGARPLGSSVLRRNAGPSAIAQPRYLTDSGRLYFDSQDSLSPFDTNEGVEDVYEFKPQGIGGCEREGGCTALLSAGREEVDSNFLAVDASGKNVFLTSRDRLVPADKDELIDLYDVREGGGFGEEMVQGPCEGECQSMPSAPPEAPPSSSTFAGPGNVKQTKPKHCKKGQVKKKGKCVKKKHKPSESKHKSGAAK